MKKKLLINILLVIFFLHSETFSKESNYFIEGMKHFKKKEFDKSKIFFERDLVFNPKSEKSYLYLAKIFKKKFVIIRFRILSWRMVTGRK